MKLASGCRLGSIIAAASTSAAASVHVTITVRPDVLRLVTVAIAQPAPLRKSAVFDAGNISQRLPDVIFSSQMPTVERQTLTAISIWDGLDEIPTSIRELIFEAQTGPDLLKAEPKT